MPDQNLTIECYLIKKKRKEKKQYWKDNFSIRCFNFDWEDNLFVDKRGKWVPWKINELTWDVSVVFHGS